MNAARFRHATAALLLMFAIAAKAESDIDRLVAQTGIELGEVALRDHPGWRQPTKIVLLDLGFPLDDIRAALPDVEIVAAQSMQELVANAPGADAVLGWCSPGFAAAEDALWIQSFSAGVERCLAVERIADRSTVLTNMQKMSSPVIAEHMVAMMLALARGLPQYAKAMPAGGWAENYGTIEGMQSIAGKRLLVVGLGGIGTEIARRSAALGMRVSGTRRSSREGPDFVEYVGLSDELLELAAEADFIVNALPLTPDTRGLFNAEFFAAAKRGAHFLNVGRGGTVVTADLVAALQSGQIAGAGLDVTDPEPLPSGHPLWQMDNVIITPHVAGGGGNRVRHTILVIENLKRFVAGDALYNVVDPEQGY